MRTGQKFSTEVELKSRSEDNYTIIKTITIVSQLGKNEDIRTLHWPPLSIIYPKTSCVKRQIAFIIRGSAPSNTLSFDLAFIPLACRGLSLQIMDIAPILRFYYSISLNPKSHFKETRYVLFRGLVALLIIQTEYDTSYFEGI